MKKTHGKIYIGKYVFLAVIIMLAAAAVLPLILKHAQSDEAKAMKVLTLLAQNLSKNADESTASALIKVKSAASAFAYPATIAMDKYISGTYDEEAMLSTIGRYRSFIKNAHLSINDPEIKMQNDHAQITFSGKFSGTTKKALSETIVQDVTVDFIKLDGQWKIKNVRFSKVLR